MRTIGATFLALGLLATAGCFGWGEDEAAAARLMATQPAAYIWSKPYPKLLIEIDHVEGAEPSQFAVDALVEMLREETSKDSIEVAPYASMPPYGTAAVEKEWTTTELRELAASTLDHADPGSFGRGDTAVLHILYIDGSSAEDSSAAGLAIGATAYLFRSPALIDTPSSAQAARPFIERSLLIHEVGHVLGLVNLHLPMQRPHEDPGSPHHSNNPESVMNSGVDAFRHLAGQIDADRAPPHRFDDDDREDVRSFRLLEP